MTVKAFELVALLEKLNLGPDRSDVSKAEIESIGVDGRHVYVGTTEGTLLQYVVNQKAVDGSDTRLPKTDRRSAFDCQLCSSKTVNSMRKPVEQVLPVSLTRHVLVVTDSTLLVLESGKLEVVLTTVRAVVHVGLNASKTTSNPFSTEVCVALKKKALQLYNLTEEQLILTREISLPEPAQLATLADTIACVALQKSYIFADCRTSKLTTLFSFSGEEESDMQPVVKAVDEGDFLLGGPGGLGMFITSAGIAARPPLSWGNGVHSVAYRHPYVVAMNNRGLAVLSILDQQSKQSLQFQTGRSLAEAGDWIVVASAKALFALVPVPIPRQVQALLSERRVDEALALARSVFSAPHASGDKPLETSAEILRMVERQAGFVEFAQDHLEEARSLFVSGGVDVREIISMFPGLPAEGVTFQRSASVISQFVDVVHESKGDSSKLELYKTFLMSYLESGYYTADARKDAHTALLKLYAERRSSQLSNFAEHSFDGHIEDCVHWLTSYGCHHTSAILFLRRGDPGRALDIWARLIDGTLTDVDFEKAGINYVAAVLSRLSDHELVMKHCDIILSRDQALGATIFTKRKSSNDHVVTSVDAVINRLEPYREGLICYLEYLINDKKLEKEVHNTHLAMLYLDILLDNVHNGVTSKDPASTRAKLLMLLKSKATCRAQQILARLQTSEPLAALLIEERAILHGRLGQHEQALRLLALEPGGSAAPGSASSSAAALRYCLLHAGGETAGSRATEAKSLFFILISIYINEASRDPRFVVPAVDLLNSPEASFDACKVLQLLPSHWSVTLLAPFLLNSTLNSLSDSRMAKVKRALASCESERVAHQLQRLRSQRVALTEDRKCDFCRRTFTEPSFIYFPDGGVCHSGNCAKDYSGSIR